MSAILLLSSLLIPSVLGQNCFWRASNTIQAPGSGWFACNNTQVKAGGAQLCCIVGSQCGEDSICHKYGFARNE
ncbi:hypothetical protein BAUCODRAFT_36264 [Baudoinia panamericana UAMH 10762]|uniref:Uncharacterized protein n=1 Tax=Baudoinia panamericana (strain UAMH 10762) TaxID=717646 RepID=M2N4X3_BAUPA|nr:uncharacterized protein BAUCODRAFT_36264 [Baudoinia panamericana UAMH 10762]EMC93810.1 hypothetical protein BAUCODRAFT_36264 [Baudoinia panamericana UAMH 10762]